MRSTARVIFYVPNIEHAFELTSNSSRYWFLILPFIHFLPTLSVVGTKVASFDYIQGFPWKCFEFVTWSIDSSSISVFVSPLQAYCIIGAW